MALHTLSICTGGTAGLELGLHIACGEILPVCYVEREATAVQTLVARMEEGALPAAPIWSDLSTFPGKPLRGLVDAISAGLPCQPYSVAGKRKGHSDERAIWPEFIRVVGEVLPELVFLENVPEFLKHFRIVGDKLQGLGYVVEEPLFLAASDVGASHRRLRIFILAYLERSRFLGRPRERIRANGSSLLASRSGFESPGVADAFGGRGRIQPEQFSECETETASEFRGDGLEHAQNGARELYSRSREPGSGETEPPGTGGNVADAQGRRQGLEPIPEREPGQGREDSLSGSDALAVSAIEGLPLGRNEIGLREPAATERSGFEFAPGPEYELLWRELLERSPYLAPAIEPGFRCVADGTSLVVDQSRTDQLRSLGNGVVPLQAAAAFTILARRAGLEIEGLL